MSVSPLVAPLTIALAPLDERPVNTRYPQMLGAIAGAAVELPPVAVRGQQRIPADVTAVGEWLAKQGETADAVIASVEYIAYGNLIHSRISGDSAIDVLPRLSRLEAIGRAGKPVYAFNLITRVPNADDCVEEPLFWGEYGTRLYKLSQLLHRREAGQSSPDDPETMALEEQIPLAFRTDWLNRRLRNHSVNLALIDLLARKRLSFLLITSDDTSEWGLPSREKAWLESWLSLLGPEISARMLTHPGADEVGSALVARLITETQGVCPTICPVYAVPGGEHIIAPYEDRPVQRTVEGQIRACGGVPVASPDTADILLVVLPPSPRRTEFRTDFADSERRERRPDYKAALEQMARWIEAGRTVALADVAYPNGADPLAMELLLAEDCPLNPGQLASFGAWNTAGNTLGTVVAQAVCSLFIDDVPERIAAQQAFLAHRFVEDYGYQTVVRKEARAFCHENFGRRDPDPENEEQIAAVCGVIADGLRRVLSAELQPHGIGTGLAIAPGSVRLPWRRTFEVDFELLRT